MVFKNNVKKSTLDIYEKNYNKLAIDVLGHISPESFEWLEDFEKIMEVINKSPSYHTRKNKINTVVVYLNLLEEEDKNIKVENVIKKYNNEISNLTKLINDNYKLNTKNDKQKNNWMTLEELNNVLIELKKDIPITIRNYSDYKKLLYYLMLATHLEFPIRNDLADCKIYQEKEFNKIEEDDTVNYIVINKKGGYLILNNYKTSGTYGRKKISLSKNLFTIYKKYYDVIINNTKDKWIFIDSNLNKLNRNGYTNLFNNLFKSLNINKNISSSLIRHIVISEKFPVSAGEMKSKSDLAYIMGHSVNEANLVYSKA